MSAFSKLLDSLEIAPKRILDVGSGHGRTTVQLQRRFPDSQISSLDFREDVCKYVKGHINEHVICADATSLPLKDKSFDLVVCDQLIEHIEDQNAFVEELDRVLVGAGYLLLGSVLRKKLALVNARNKEGKLVLIPEHVREYGSEQEFANVLKGFFNDIRVSVSRFYTLPHVTIYRILTRWGLIKWDEQFEQRYDPDFMSNDSLLRKLIIKIPLPGYYYIYGIAKKPTA